MDDREQMKERLDAVIREAKAEPDWDYESLGFKTKEERAVLLFILREITPHFQRALESGAFEQRRSRLRKD